MKYFFADYNWIERQFDNNREALRALGITDVVGVSRGGIYPATLAAFALDLPGIHLLNYDRSSNAVEWQGYRGLSKDSVVLLCEDVAGEGQTFKHCIEFIREKTQHLHTLTIYHSTGSAVKPDFGYDAGDVSCIFPWERYFINPQARLEWKEFRKQSKPDTEYFKYGSDMDGVFLPDIDDSLYQTDLPRALRERSKLKPYDAALFPDIPLAETTIISGRPTGDQTTTEVWLKEHAIDVQEVVLRNEREIDFLPGDDHYTKAEKAAISKSQSILRLGITHYYESDPLQSILIANKVPMVRVCWWNNALMVRKWITATSAQQAKAA